MKMSDMFVIFTIIVIGANFLWWPKVAWPYLLIGIIAGVVAIMADHKFYWMWYVISVI